MLKWGIPAAAALIALFAIAARASVSTAAGMTATTTVASVFQSPAFVPVAETR